MSRYSRGSALEAVEAPADKIALTLLDAENTLPPAGEIKRTAERWAEQDVVALVVYDEPLAIQKRRRHLAGCLLAARAARAGDLADMAYDESPRFGVDKR